jgi:hypothetical protein
MTEVDACVLLHNWTGVGGLEAWIAGRRRQAVPGGWAVAGELQGWRFKVEVIPEALRLTAWPPSGSPAAWEVLPR